MAFAGIQQSLQHKWTLVQWIMDTEKYDFERLESVISILFIPSIFGVIPCDRELNRIPFCVGGLSLPNPMTMTRPNYTSS